MINAQSSLIGWVALIGGLILAAVLLWANLRNRGQSRDGIDRSERGARDLRGRIDRDDES